MLNSQAAWAADKWALALVETQFAMHVSRNTDSRAYPNFSRWPHRGSKPYRASWIAQIDTVETLSDIERDGEAPRPSRDIEHSRNFATMHHLLKAL